MAERQPGGDVNNGEQMPNVNEPQGANVCNVASPVAGIKPPQSLCIDANVTANWKLFKQKWHNDRYAVGETNETYERFVFHMRKQEEGESVEAYIAALRTLIKTCDFCDNCVNSVLRDQIVLGIRNCDTQSELLKVRHLELQVCIDTCKLSKNAAHQSRALRPETVNKVNARPRNKPFKHSKPKPEEKSCKYCTSQHEMRKEACPAYGKICAKCKGRNHFAARCKASKKRVNMVRVEAEGHDSEYEPVDTVMTREKVNSLSLKMIKAEMLVGENSFIEFQLDTGASLNLLNERHVDSGNILPSSKTLVMWNGTELKPKGECRVKVVNPKNGKKYGVNFVIVEEDLHPLLGATAIQNMGLITVNKNEFNMVAKVTDMSTEDLVGEFKDVFADELGTLPGTVHLETNPNITPHTSPDRRVPVAIKPKLQDELDRLVQKNVIEPVSEPTNWVSGLALVVKKSVKLRICIDPKPLNKAQKREHFHLPVLDDLLPDLADVKVFSTLDLRDGFWHLRLDEESTYLTTFATPFGRFRWKVLQFGIAPAPEIFQKIVYNNVSDLAGVFKKADDLLVCGKGPTFAEAVADHDIKLHKLL